MSFLVVRLHEPRSIEWNLHSWGEFLGESHDGIMQWMIPSPRGSSVRLTVFEPLPLKWLTGRSEFVPAYPNDGRRDYFLRLLTRGHSGRFVWVLLFSGEGQPVATRPDTASLRFQDGTCTMFHGKWILKDREAIP